MFDDLSDLYQQVILDHCKKPRNYHELSGATRSAQGHNPLCGDQFTIYLNMNGEVISEVTFEGSGCAISKASASLMTTVLKGKTVTEARALFEHFHEMVTSAPDTEINEAAVGKLRVLGGVRDFPIRIKCATLAWHTSGTVKSMTNLRPVHFHATSI